MNKGRNTHAPYMTFSALNQAYLTISASFRQHLFAFPGAVSTYGIKNSPTIVPVEAGTSPAEETGYLL